MPSFADIERKDLCRFRINEISILVKVGKVEEEKVGCNIINCSIVL